MSDGSGSGETGLMTVLQERGGKKTEEGELQEFSASIGERMGYGVTVKKSALDKSKRMSPVIHERKTENIYAVAYMADWFGNGKK